MSKWEFYIAGVQHHQSNDVIGYLKCGTILGLDPEPTNKYDPNAVRITFSNEENQTLCMLGYVPARFSPEVSAFLECNDKVTCIISELAIEKKPWERIKVVIEEKEEEKSK